MLETWKEFAPRLHAILRIVAGIAFVTFGTTALFAFPAGVPPNGGTVPLASEAGIGALLQIVGGALMALGLFTRPVAFVLAGEMAVAYFQFHAPHSFWPSINQGMPAILYCLIWLWMSAAGPGAWSLDALRAAAREPRPATVA